MTRTARARVAGFALAAALAAAFLAVACDGSGGRSGPGRQRAAPAATAAYPGIVAAAARERSALATEWRAARTPAEQERVLSRASSALTRIVADRILPAWNGTPWAYSGTARAPGERPIACGYLVSTALEHAGLRVERKLAQQAAEHIVMSLVPAPRIARFKRVPLGPFLAAVARDGDGVYLVGLDRHVGFLVIEDGGLFFHHSSRQAGAVLREPALLSRALARSSYRVVGKLFDERLARSWLTGSPVPTLVR